MGGSNPFKKPKAPTPKSEEQPKVQAQMDNNVAGPAGPTDVELDKEALKTKRKGRRYSILTSSTGLESKPTLSTKTLLG